MLVDLEDVGKLFNLHWYGRSEVCFFDGLGQLDCYSKSKCMRLCTI